jgi:hypothetical protein
MKLYEHEINDNLKEVMESNQTIAFNCNVLSKDISEKLSLESKTKEAFASLDITQEKQKDLYYLNSVLVSAGWNKNDDVFGAKELWEARSTPINKQFNYMHDETDIIGHMTNAIVLDQEGNVIKDDSEVDSIPEKIDIITSAVIYTSWSDLSLVERIQELTSKIDAGELSVSMECLFHDFDYAIIDTSGSNKVLARSEDSSFLTKHLRAYGGSGEYEGFKVGRFLKSFYFTGKGLVDKPANPRSIILSKDIDPFDSIANITFNKFLTATEVPMPDVNKDISQLQAELLESKATILNLEKELKEYKEASATYEQKDKTLEANQVKIAELEDSVASLTEAKKKTDEEKKDLNDKFSKMKKDVKNMKRKASLSEAGADETQSDEIIEQFSDSTDEQFEAIVALIVKKAETPTPPPIEEEEEVEAEEDVDTSILDDAEAAEASIVKQEAETDEITVAQKAAAFIRGNVLKTTKNLK